MPRNNRARRNPQSQSLATLEQELGIKFDWGLRVAAIDGLSYEDDETEDDQETDEAVDRETDDGPADDAWVDFDALDQDNPLYADDEGPYLERGERRRDKDWERPNPNTRERDNERAARNDRRKDRQQSRAAARDEKASGNRAPPLDLVRETVGKDIQQLAATVQSTVHVFGAAAGQALAGQCGELAEEALRAKSVDQLEGIQARAGALSAQISALADTRPDLSAAARFAEHAIGTEAYHRRDEISKALTDMRAAFSDGLADACGKAADTLISIRAAQLADRQKFIALQTQVDPKNRYDELKAFSDTLVPQDPTLKVLKLGQISSLRVEVKQLVDTGFFLQARKRLLNVGSRLKYAEQAWDVHEQLQELDPDVNSLVATCQSLISKIRVADKGFSPAKDNEVLYEAQNFFHSAREKLDLHWAGQSVDKIRDVKRGLDQALKKAMGRGGTGQGGGGIVFDPEDSSTWIIEPLDNRANWAPSSAPSDAKLLEAITNCEKSARHGSTIATGIAMHQHCGGGRGGGSDGISFAYNHLGDRRVQPVIYDFGSKVTGSNDFSWSGGRSNGPSALPGDIRRVT